MIHLIRRSLYIALIFACATSAPSQQQGHNKDFLDAVENGDLRKIQASLDAGADVNAQEHIKRPFCFAVCNKPARRKFGKDAARQRR